MKATGIVRRIDDLNRIVIPKEIKRKLNIAEDEACVDMGVIAGCILIRKSEEPEYAIDDLGRLAIPKHILENLEIGNNSPMEFFTKDDTIIIKKYLVAEPIILKSMSDILSELTNLIESNNDVVGNESKIDIINHISEIRKILNIE